MSVQILAPAAYPAGRLRFAPNSWAQRRFMESPAPLLLYSGRYGSSKSRTLTEKADLFCRTQRGARVVLARKTRTSLGLTTLRTLLEQTITPAHREEGWRPGADGGSTLYYRNGSQLLCVGLDNPGRLKSGEFGLALVDQAEELDEDEWNGISGRLRHPVGPYRQLAGACNPDSPGHFLFQQFQPTRSHIQRSTEPKTLPTGKIIPVGRMLYETIMAGPIDNMENLGDDYIERLTRLRGRYYQRYALGQWVAFEGLVYDCFDMGIHAISRPKAWTAWGGYPPPDWPRYRSIDFGYVNPFVCQWWAKSPGDTWFMYREIYHSRRTNAEHAKAIHRAEDRELAAIRKAWPHDREDPAPDQLNIVMTVADHDASERASLVEANIGTDAADKDVENGIQTVYEMMQPFGDEGNLQSRIYLLNDALIELDPTLEYEKHPTSTLGEFYNYRYPKAPVSSDRVVKEQPIDRDNHGMDAMRYLHHTVKRSGPMEIVWL